MSYTHAITSDSIASTSTLADCTQMLSAPRAHRSLVSYITAAAFTFVRPFVPKHNKAPFTPLPRPHEHMVQAAIAERMSDELAHTVQTEQDVLKATATLTATPEPSRSIIIPSEESVEYMEQVKLEEEIAELHDAWTEHVPTKNEVPTAQREVIPSVDTQLYLEQLALEEETERLQEGWADVNVTLATVIPSAESIEFAEQLALEQELTQAHQSWEDRAPKTIVPVSDPAKLDELMFGQPMNLLAEYGMNPDGPIDGVVVIDSLKIMRDALHMNDIEDKASHASSRRTMVDEKSLKALDDAINIEELAFTDGVLSPLEIGEKVVRRSNTFRARVRSLLPPVRKWIGKDGR